MSPVPPEADPDSGQARLRVPMFPLGSVHFPGVAVPLHVFEDRYRALIHHLIPKPPAERVLGTVAIREGYEVGDHGAQSVHRVGCLLQLTEVEDAGEGRFDIAVVGRRRLHLHEMDVTSEPYLVGTVSLIDDEVPAPGTPLAGAEDEAMARTIIAFDAYRTALGELRGTTVLTGTIPNDPLWCSYALAATCLLTLRERQALLEADDTLTRLAMLQLAMRDEMRAIRAVPSLPATEVARTRWSPN